MTPRTEGERERLIERALRWARKYIRHQDKCPALNSMGPCTCGAETDDNEIVKALAALREVERECPDCDSDGEVLSGDTPNGPMWDTCVLCGGSGTRPSDDEVRALRQDCWNAEGNLQAMTYERDQYRAQCREVEGTRVEGLYVFDLEVWWADYALSSDDRFGSRRPATLILHDTEKGRDER